MPPSPELEQKILRAKALLEAGQQLPAKAGGNQLDQRALTLILSRPAQTRPDTFIDARADPGPSLGRGEPSSCWSTSPTRRRPRPSALRRHDVLARHLRHGQHARLLSRSVLPPARCGRGVSGSGGPTAGWYRAPQPKSYYTDANYGFGGYPKNAQKLVEEAIALADPNVDFSLYDNDGDGVVDALVVICAGSGAEQTGNVNDIWSHKWSITPQVRDGVTIDRYFMAPEDGRVGVMSHELGHLLMGWPDLYDTDYSSAGTGAWDLMAGGSWNGGGDKPAHPTSWCKTRVQWVNPTVLWNVTQSVNIPPYATSAVAYKLPIGSAASQEYFLVSNRQKAGFDGAMPGEGMIIEHIDDTKNNNTDENHYLVDVEQADGRRDLNLNANRGDATDPFPITTNASFTGSSSPNSNAYSGAASNISVTNIARVGDNVTADIQVGSGAAAGKQWYYNRTVASVFAYYTTQWAWANISGLGWRRINGGSADGVSNMFVSLCEAAANGRQVHVEADSGLLYTMYLI